MKIDSIETKVEIYKVNGKEFFTMKDAQAFKDDLDLFTTHRIFKVQSHRVFFEPDYTGNDYVEPYIILAPFTTGINSLFKKFIQEGNFLFFKKDGEYINTHIIEDTGFFGDFEKIKDYDISVIDEHGEKDMPRNKAIRRLKDIYA